MSSFVVRTLAIVGIAAGISFAASSPALACPTGKNWSSVKVNQNQQVWSASPASMAQAAYVETGTSVGNVTVSSKSWGGQQLENVKKGHQLQEVKAASGLNWQSNKSPSAFTATTQGSVSQQQRGWSDHSTNVRQIAGTEQGSWQGNRNISNASSELRQESTNVRGDSLQQQSLKGRTQAKGFVNLPWFNHNSSGGSRGSIFQNVNVHVQNIINW